MRRHLQQPTAVDLDHLSVEEEKTEQKSVARPL